MCEKSRVSARARPRGLRPEKFAEVIQRTRIPVLEYRGAVQPNLRAQWRELAARTALLHAKDVRVMDVSKLQEKKAALEEELLRTEENIYDLEGEYLQACAPELLLPTSPGRADGCVPAPGRRR